MTLVSLTINLDETLYQDGVDITRDQLYEWLMENNGLCNELLFEKGKMFSESGKMPLYFALNNCQGDF